MELLIEELGGSVIMLLLGSGVIGVDAFPGHIACSSLSRSEIVVPLKREDGEVWGVLDIDRLMTRL